jgi:hypothetical protein
MCECWTSSRAISEDLLWKDVPKEHRGDFDFIVALLDWEKNTDPNFFQERFMSPIGLHDGQEGLDEKWVVYLSTSFSAKELTLAPRTEAVVRDAAAYGFIVTQGRGTFGAWTVESPTLVRFGQLTSDEYFVSEEAASSGVLLRNLSETEPLVMLKHFGPENPEVPRPAAT